MSEPADPLEPQPAERGQVREFVEETIGRLLLNRVAQALPDDVVVALRVSGAGGGDWQIERTPQGTRLSPLRSGSKDCTVSCSASDFLALVKGELDPRDAYLKGRIGLTGDIGLALSLHGVLSKER